MLKIYADFVVVLISPIPLSSSQRSAIQIWQILPNRQNSMKLIFQINVYTFMGILNFTRKFYFKYECIPGSILGANDTKMYDGYCLQEADSLQRRKDRQQNQ